MAAPLAIDSDNDVLFNRVRYKDPVSGEWVFLNAGTADWTLYSKSGRVYTEIGTGTLTYSGTDGKYTGVIPASVASSDNLNPGQTYYVRLTFSEGQKNVSKELKRKAAWIE